MPAQRTTNVRKHKDASQPYSKITPKPKPNVKGNATTRPLGVSTPLENFFSQYPKFQYQPSNSPVAEFNRLCKEYKLGKDDSKKKKKMRDGFNKAIKNEFDNLYGSDENDIKNWYRLCHVLKIDPVPDTLKGCRTAVLEKHVNLVDLVEGDKKEVQIFGTEKELSEYTRKTAKFFPKENAADGGVLRALRRHILAPRDDAPRLRLRRSSRISGK